MTVIPGVESQKTTATKAHTLTLACIETATAGFMFADDMRAVVSLALAAGENFVFSGPGGHGKSEFLNAAFAAIEDVDPFLKSLGQGTTPEELFGGIDFKKFDTERIMEFATESSFMSHEVAVFEETFDAPERSLNFLKDVLTAQELRNGTQRVKLVNRVLAAATNMSPTQIASANRSVAALIERFPLQWEVKWPSYTADNFTQLFNIEFSDVKPSITWAEIAEMQAKTKTVKVGSMVKQILAHVLAELRKEHKVTISPRTAMKTLHLVKAAAVINGRDTAVIEDIQVVKYLPGCQDKHDEILEMIEKKKTEFKIQEILNDIDVDLGIIRSDFDKAESLMELEDLQRKLQYQKTRLSIEVEMELSDLASFKTDLIRKSDDLNCEIEQKLAPFRAMQEQKRREQRISQIEKNRRQLQRQIDQCKSLSQAQHLQRELKDMLRDLENFTKDSNSLLALRAQGVYDSMRSLEGFVERRVSKFQGSRNNGWNNNGYQR